ncbi:MAG: hypothetical protein PVJ27_04170 [Candidatus Brocadiaceae bacterium]|jgi:hypothetical protein
MADRMTPRERVLAVLNGEQPDEVPFTVYECMIPQCAVERDLRNAGLCIVNRHHEGYTSQTPNCTRETRRYSEEGRPRVRTVVRTPVGEVSTVTEPAGDREPFFTSWTLEPYFKGPEDYDVLLYMTRDKVYRPAYEAFARAERWMGEDVILRANVGSNPLHRIMGWMGLETFAVEWHGRRARILELEAAMCENKREVFRIVAGGPITHANFGGNMVPEVMGLERMEEFVLPLWDECAEVFHANGKLLGSHMDGNNRAWADLIAGSRLDYIEAFTPAPDTDMTLAEALEAWPRKVLWVNFPSSVHVAGREKVRETAREIVELGRRTNRVILGITEDIPADRWQDNLLTISEAINA